MVKYKKTLPLTIKYNPSIPLLLLKELIIQCLLWSNATIKIHKKYGMIKINGTPTDYEIDSYLYRTGLTKHVQYKRGNIKLASFEDNFDHLL